MSAAPRLAINASSKAPRACKGATSQKNHETVMKKDIHPDYHEITVVMTDGTSFKTRSTYGQAGDSLRLDIDPKTHPAWTGVSRVNERGGRVARFKERFGSVGQAKK